MRATWTQRTSQRRIAGAALVVSTVMLAAGGVAHASGSGTAQAPGPALSTPTLGHSYRHGALPLIVGPSASAGAPARTATRPVTAGCTHHSSGCPIKGLMTYH